MAEENAPPPRPPRRPGSKTVPQRPAPVVPGMLGQSTQASPGSSPMPRFTTQQLQSMAVHPLVQEAIRRGVRPEQAVAMILNHRMPVAFPAQNALQRLSGIAAGQPPGLQVASESPSRLRLGVSASKTVPSSQHADSQIREAQPAPALNAQYQSPYAPISQLPSPPASEAAVTFSSYSGLVERPVLHGGAKQKAVSNGAGPGTPSLSPWSTAPRGANRARKNPAQIRASKNTPVGAVSTPDIDDYVPSSRDNLRSAHRKLSRKRPAGSSRQGSADTPVDDSPLPSIESHVGNVSVQPGARRRRIVYDVDDERSTPTLSERPHIASTAARSSSVSEALMLPQEVLKPRVPSRPSQLDYFVPEKLQSAKAAMGEMNWIEYVKLMEAFYEGDIRIDEFDREAAKLFQIQDEKIRKMMRSLINQIISSRKNAEAENKA